MAGRVNRSIRLLQESWAILNQDRELVIFPICSAVCSVVASATFIVPWLVFGGAASFADGGHRAGPQSPAYYLFLFLFYLVNYAIVVFFNSGLVACAGARLRGENPTAADGFRFAFDNIGRILAWAVFSATVGTILRAVEERVSFVGRLVAGLVGLAWTLATAFVVPVLVFEQAGPITAVKRSAEIFRRTWGESMIGNAGLGLLFFGLVVLGFIPIALGFVALPWGLALGIVVSVVYWIGLAVVQTALQGIFQTALYEYAANGIIAPAFSPDLITEAYIPRKRR